MNVGPKPEEAALAKEVYTLLPETLRALAGVETGDEAETPLLNAAGERVRLRFRVTRNARLGKYWHYLFGEVLDPPAPFFRTVEFRLHSEAPEKSTVAVYAAAPPIR